MFYENIRPPVLLLGFLNESLHGQTWAPCKAEGINLASLLDIQPADGTTFFALLKEGKGVIVSRDAGLSWLPFELPSSIQNPSAMYAGEGILLLGGYESGVWRFDLTQSKWTHYPALNNRRITSVAWLNGSVVIGCYFEPENPVTVAVYDPVKEEFKRPHLPIKPREAIQWFYVNRLAPAYLLAAGESGIWHAGMDALAWENGFGNEEANYRYGTVWHIDGGRTHWYAATDAGLLVSRNTGRTWAPVVEQDRLDELDDDDPMAFALDWIASQRLERVVVIDPFVLVPTASGCFLSADRGLTWHVYNGPPEPVDLFKVGKTGFAPGRDQRLYRTADLEASLRNWHAEFLKKK